MTDEESFVEYLKVQMLKGDVGAEAYLEYIENTTPEQRMQDHLRIDPDYDLYSP